MLQTHFELAGPIRLKHVTLFGCRVGGDEGDLSFCSHFDRNRTREALIADFDERRQIMGAMENWRWD